MQIFLLETLLKAKKKRLVHILILHIYPILTNFVTQEKKNGYFVYQSLCNNIVRMQKETRSCYIVVIMLSDINGYE